MCGMNLVVRTLLVCGVNRVTRCLERDELQHVVVDRSSPWQLHQHLAQLSAVRGCKAVAIDNLSASLSPLLAVSRLCAVGIKVMGVVVNSVTLCNVLRIMHCVSLAILSQLSRFHTPTVGTN